MANKAHPRLAKSTKVRTARKGKPRRRATPPTVPKVSDETVAMLALWPATASAQMVATYKSGLCEPVPKWEALCRELNSHIEAIKSGDLSLAESMLVAQAVSLDAIYNNRMLVAFENFKANCFEAGDMLVRQALRAQAQSRATLETLAYLKNPPSANFIRTGQANIAQGPQQVVNGAPLAPGQAPPAAAPSVASRAREEATQNLPNEPQLLEAQHGGGLDPGTASPASEADPALEAVAVEHRAAHGSGQGPGGAKRAPRRR